MLTPHIPTPHILIYQQIVHQQMAAREYFLVQLPPAVSASEITKVKTVDELEKVCSRLTDTVENDMKKRLFVYREEKDKWHAEAKIKRIYKYVKKVEKKQERTDTRPTRKFRTHKTAE